MVRLFYLAGLAATAIQAQQQQHQQQENDTASIMFDTNPNSIDDLGSTLAVVPLIVHPDSPLLKNTTDIALQERSDINVVTVIVASVSAGFTAILAAKAGLDFYDNIIAKIKSQSDQNSCTLVYGQETVGGIYQSYAYQATTTGKNCDTTALEKTIKKAVYDCADRLSESQATFACCRFDHEGTWTGHLAISSDPKNHPAQYAPC